MLLNDSEVEARITSPMNLLNRLRKQSVNVPLPTAPSLIITKERVTHPSIPPSAEELIEDLEGKIKSKITSKRAISIMSSTLEKLEERLDEINEPADLMKVATGMSKVYHELRTANAGDKGNTIERVQVVIYTPQVLSEADLPVINVND